jgi:hypothetical protein
MSYDDSVPQMGRAVTLVWATSFSLRACVCQMHKPILFGGMIHAIETLQQMQKALRISCGVLSDVSPGGYGCA